MGIQPGTVAAYESHILGMHRDVWTQVRPALIRENALPFEPLDSDVGLYNFLDRTGGTLPDASEVPDGTAGYTDDYLQANFNFGTGTIRTKYFPGRLFTINAREDQILRAMNSSLDKERTSIKYNDGIMAAAIVNDFKGVAAGLSATTFGSGTWGISTATFDLRNAILSTLEETDALGSAADTMYIGKGAARVLSNLNAVTLTPNSVGGSSVSRVGQDQPGTFTDNYAGLKRYFADEFGLNLIIEDLKFKTGAYALTTEFYIYNAGDAANKTFLLAGDPAEGQGLVRYEVQQTVHPKPEGISVACSARFGTNLMFAASGRKGTFTLS